jgi:chromate transporter
MGLHTALAICMVFGVASVLSIGGGNSVVPEIELQAVHTYGWLTSLQFADLFAIAQAAPGPSMLFVTLIGYKAAGLWGALLATVAMILPAGLIVYVAARAWQSSAKARWHVAMEHGLAPIAVGLVAASGWIIAHSAEKTMGQVMLTVVATLVLSFTKLNPLYLVVAGGFVGWMGWV